MMILPDLVMLDDYNGDWNNYLEAVYYFFVRDFVKEGIFYNKKRIFYISKPFYKDKEFSFWHMITQGKIRNDYNLNKKQTPPLKGGIRFSTH